MFGFALTALAFILFIVDPLGAMPPYLAMTQGDDAAKRRRRCQRFRQVLWCRARKLLAFLSSAPGKKHRRSAGNSYRWRCVSIFRRTSRHPTHAGLGH